MALNGNTNEEKIWNFLKSKGLNSFAVAGLMGNLFAESGLNPKNLQNSYEKKLGHTDETYTAAVDSGKYKNFKSDAAGYGLAQWTYGTRKAALLEYAKSVGKSVGDLEMQLGFLMKELTGNYAGVLAEIKKATSVLQASNTVLMKFERPADQSEAVQKKRAAYGQTYYDKYAVVETNTQNGGRGKMNNIEYVEKLKDIAKNYKTLYVMGCFGAPMTEANKKRYCNNHDYNKQSARTAMIKAASADTFGFDCVCLLKAVLWGWNGNKNHQYGGATYASNEVPDIGADTFITKCKEVTTDFSKIEVGEAVWLSGHIGVYIGGGLAVECTPSFANKVQITAVKNIGSKNGYSARQWTKHGKIPYIDYVKTEDEPKPEKPKQEEQKPDDNAEFALGEVVMFNGNTHYTSANATDGKSCKPGKAKVTQKYNGKHPYHVVREGGDGGSVWGWVNASDLSHINSAAERTYTVKSGDSLWAIAAKQLGDGSRYNEIKTMNGLSSNTIYAGQVLKLPTK